jgi:hypothetical protein
MTVRRLTLDDVGWAVDRLAARRARLLPYAPVYWHTCSARGAASGSVLMMP